MESYADKILNSLVSFQKDTWASLSKQMPIKEVLKEISNDTHKEKIDHLRKLIEEGDLESYKALKLKLPAVTFCGTFLELRKKDNLKEYNEIIVIDIDKLTKEDLPKVIAHLENDSFVFSFWLSPSNNGIKGIVPLKYDFEIGDVNIAHKSAFEKLSKYFLDLYDITLDGSGNDTTRLCFMSNDPHLMTKHEIKPFIINLNDLIDEARFEHRENKKIKLYNSSKKNALSNPAGKNRGFHKREIKDIINYLTKRKIVITGKYEHRFKIGYAIANTFTYDIGSKFYFDLCKIEFEKFNENKSRSLLEYCYENNTGWTRFRYIEDLVKNQGYIKKTLEKVVS